MRGVRSTLDRQLRLEKLSSHGQHKWYFKRIQPADTLRPILSPKNTQALAATSIDAFRIVKTLRGVFNYPTFLFQGREPETWLELAKGSKCSMALGAELVRPQIVSSQQIGIAVKGRKNANANANTVIPWRNGAEFVSVIPHWSDSHQIWQ